MAHGTQYIHGAQLKLPIFTRFPHEPVNLVQSRCANTCVYCGFIDFRSMRSNLQYHVMGQWGIQGQGSKGQGSRVRDTV